MTVNGTARAKVVGLYFRILDVNNRTFLNMGIGLVFYEGLNFETNYPT